MPTFYQLAGQFLSGLCFGLGIACASFPMGYLWQSGAIRAQRRLNK
jgi:hypothetical protein